MRDLQSHLEDFNENFENFQDDKDSFLAPDGSVYIGSPDVLTYLARNRAWMS